MDVEKRNAREVVEIYVGYFAAAKLKRNFQNVITGRRVFRRVRWK